MRIQSGDESNRYARVTQRGLEADATTKTASDRLAELGHGYHFHSGALTITNDTENAVYYFKNTDSQFTLAISQVIYILGATTGGSGDARIKLVRNPTGGTLVDNGTAKAPVNRDFGSARVLTATALFMDTVGRTLTGQDTDPLLDRALTAPAVSDLMPGEILLPPGTSFGVLYTAPGSNTSQTFMVAGEMHLLAEG